MSSVPAIITSVDVVIDGYKVRGRNERNEIN